MPFSIVPQVTGTWPVPGYDLETGCQSDIVDCLTLCVHSQAVRRSTTTKIRVKITPMDRKGKNDGECRKEYHSKTSHDI